MLNTETDQTLIDAIKNARDILDKPKPYPSALDRAVEQTRLPDMNAPLSNPPAIHCQAIQDA